MSRWRLVLRIDEPKYLASVGIAFALLVTGLLLWPRVERNSSLPEHSQQIGIQPWIGKEKATPTPPSLADDTRNQYDPTNGTRSSSEIWKLTPPPTPSPELLVHFPEEGKLRS